MDVSLLLNDLRLSGWVKGRDILSDIGFWLVLLGYHTRTRKVDSWTYLVYAVLFFTLWIFMVLLLFADFGANLLLTAGELLESTAAAAVLVGSLAIIILFMIDLYQASRRSPFVFSEEDSLLLCQTPVDRRSVILTWFAAGWLGQGWKVWAVAVILGYAYLQATFGRALAASDLPVYLLAGLRMVSLGLPLHLALMALAWAAGALRLHGDREPRLLRYLPSLLVLAGAAAWALSGWGRLPAWLAPVTLPIRAGLGLAPWWMGSLVAWGLALLALVLLGWVAKPVSLTRAAQETREVQIARAAGALGRMDVLEELQQRRRLGAGGRSTRLRTSAGWPVLVWKSLLQYTRLPDVLPWLLIAGLCLGFFLLPNWQTRAWVGLVWVIQTSQVAAKPLQKDLSRWWLLHQLPFRAETLVASALLRPICGLWLAGIIGALAAAWLGGTFAPGLLVLYLLCSVGVALAALIDLLRVAKTDLLLIGVTPGPSLLALVLGVVFIAFQAWVVWQSGRPGGQILALVLPFVDLGLLYALWQLAGTMLRGIGK